MENDEEKKSFFIVPKYLMPQFRGKVSDIYPIVHLPLYVAYYHLADLESRLNAYLVPTTFDFLVEKALEHSNEIMKKVGFKQEKQMKEGE